MRNGGRCNVQARFSTTARLGGIGREWVVSDAPTWVPGHVSHQGDGDSRRAQSGRDIPTPYDPSMIPC